MEKDQDIENVVYMNEYPELKRRLSLRRLAASAVGAALHQIVQFERPEPPDGAA